MTQKIKEHIKKIDTEKEVATKLSHLRKMKDEIKILEDAYITLLNTERNKR